MGLDHVGLVVSDAQAASDFLIDVFGCSFDWEVRREPTPTAGQRFIDHRLGPRSWADLFGVHPDSHMPHVIMLRGGEAHLAQYIELFEWSAPDQRKEWPKFSDIGHAYISFTVKDTAAVVEHIKQLAMPGLRVIQDPPMRFEMKDEICTSTFVVTPWQFWIEITEWSRSKETGKVMSLPRRSPVASHFQVAASGRGENHPQHRHADIGKSILDCETPRLFVDLDAVEHNAQLMAKRIKGAGMVWRPPVKAHRCPSLAKLLLRSGAEGILCLTVSEAESFADWGGFNSIMIGNVIAGEGKLRRLAALAGRVPDLRVCVDDATNLTEVHAALRSAGTQAGVLVELNIGHNRCGVLPAEAPALVAQCMRLTEETQRGGGGIAYVGLHGYEGHTPILPPDEKAKETARAQQILAHTRRLLQEQGLSAPYLTGGGSCNYPQSIDGRILSELHAGGGALTDLLYAGPGGLHQHGHLPGAFVLTQAACLSYIAGFKALGWHPFGGLAQPWARPDLEVTGLSAEHCKIYARAGSDGTRPPVDLARGQRVVLQPGYTDALGYAYRLIYAVRKGVVVDVWPTVASGVEN